jgi:hypothetical protein
MSKPTSLAVSALMLIVSAGAALADGTSGFSAANTLMLRGYTASPAQLYLPAPNRSDAVAAGPVSASQRRPAPVRAR